MVIGEIIRVIFDFLQAINQLLANRPGNLTFTIMAQQFKFIPTLEQSRTQIRFSFIAEE